MLLRENTPLQEVHNYESFNEDVNIQLQKKNKKKKLFFILRNKQHKTELMIQKAEHNEQDSQVFLKVFL